tara:strand:+ start:516 stop:752 length:237 start_codon:yes stop_codon:yes gene_type:complete
MNNADMPAMPNSIEVIPDTAPLKWPHGLTKREHFAGLAMQGLLNFAEPCWVDDPKNRLNDVPSEAVALADALLKELEK